MNGHRLAGGVLLVAAAAGAATLGSAGSAGATCASISGISAGSSGGSACTSTPTSFAIGIGDNTFASAKGLFTGAIAVGANNGATDATTASSTGAFSLALAAGKNTLAETNGNVSLAVAQGTGAAGNNPVSAFAGNSAGDNLNVAINVGGKAAANQVNWAIAAGQGNIVASVGTDSGTTRGSLTQAYGTGNAAFNLGGVGNYVSAGNLVSPAESGIPLGTKSTLGLAFQALGNNNTVTAVGPFAVAGAIGTNNLNGANRVLQSGPGVNINNL